MPDIDTGALRKVAEAATPGPWTVKHHGAGGVIEAWAVETDDPQRDAVCIDFDRDYGDPMGGCEDEATALHIAAFDPPTVLALLDRLEAAEAKVARVEALREEFKSRGGLTLLVETGESVAGMLEAALEDRR